MEERINKNELLGIKPGRIHDKPYKEPTFGFLVNLIPAFIWALVITDQALPWELGFWQKFGIGVAFIIAYIVVSKIPFLTFVSNIASLIMFVGLLWVPVNYIGIDWLRITLKVVIAVWAGILELGTSFMITVEPFTRKSQVFNY